MFDSRYSVVRRDRNNDKARGRGVLLALKKNIQYEIVECNCDIECIVMKVKQNKRKYVYVSIVFLPPNSIMELYENYFSIFEDLLIDENGSLLLGDSNLLFVETNINGRSRCLDLIISNTHLRVQSSGNPLFKKELHNSALCFVFALEASIAEDTIKNATKYCYAK
ncbi:hypothetical protein HHI36_005182, partial [Cryptolaemus montrouzieri]